MPNKNKFVKICEKEVKNNNFGMSKNEIKIECMYKWNNLPTNVKKKYK